MLAYPRLARLLQGGVWTVALLSVLVSVMGFLLPDPTEKALRWPVSPVLLDKEGRLVHARLSAAQEWCLPVPLEEMGDWLPRVLIAVEDRRFYAHRGIDLLSLGRATVMNAAKGRVVSGASTITSQLVRISNPSPRVWSTKVREFLQAWKLEQNLSKKQILELYLNRAPFGGPIRGVEAASRLYFDKRAKDLSLGEAALLVGMLKGPTAYRPDRNPKKSLERRQHIIRRIASSGIVASDMAELSLKEPLPAFKPVMPQEAWHFADLAFNAEFGRTAPFFQQSPLGPSAMTHMEGALRKKRMTSAGAIHSTLDRGKQALLELTLVKYLAGADDALTAAGIVIDNRDGSVAAYVGNARFDPSGGRHWVDCAVAPRSPGSTLKPFVYLRAMERGLIIPASLLADTPLRFGGEAPRNFDRLYRGPVSASVALASSLNAPAVRVHRMLGTEAVLQLLREAGFSFLNRDGVYGDSLVLGAGEVSLLELARAYTALAGLGLDRPLAWKRDKGNANAMPGMTASGLATARQLEEKNGERVNRPARRLYSRAASYLTADILSDSSRLPFIVQLTQAREDTPVAFKTGTSYGFRDAWTVAYCPAFTVALWFGREDGGPDALLSGASMATPPALEILREITKDVPRRAAWYDVPESVEKKNVCALSGASPSRYCSTLREAWVIPSVWRTTPCAMHALREGRIQVVWPPELEDFQKKRFTVQDMSRPVQIVSPLEGTSYLITPGVRSYPLPLRAEGATYPVHWFADGEYLGEQREQTVPLYWMPPAGKHALSLMDAREQTASCVMEVIDLGASIKKDQPLF